MSVQSAAGMNSFPLMALSGAVGFEDFVPVIFVAAENDPVDFDALNIVCPNSNKHGEITAVCRALIIKAIQHYSGRTNLRLQIFFSSDDWLYVSSNNSIPEEDSLPKYVHPKKKIGTYAPLVNLNAPLDLEKPFEKMPNGKLIFTDGCGVRIKDIPGLVLNDCYPGLDGAVYSIDYSADFKEWSLYRCCKIKKEDNFVIEIEKVGRSLTVKELNSEPESVNILYAELERMDICLSGAEVIALGLPVHRGNF